MFRWTKSGYKLWLFVSLVLLVFAMHFIVAMIFRASPDLKVSDSFDAYLKPGIYVLLVLGAPFLRGWLLGLFLYFGAMFFYSVLLTLAFFGIYKAVRFVLHPNVSGLRRVAKVIKIKTQGQIDLSPDKNPSVDASGCVQPDASAKLRIIGVLYLLLGGLFILFVVFVPGIISSAPAVEYHPPHACECLECIHGYLTGPDGQLYCAKFPPMEIIDARTPSSVVKGRLIGGAACGIAGLAFAVSMVISGLLWLFRLWIPRRPRQWYAVMCLAAPVIVVFFWLTSGYLECVYPITPM